MSVAIQDQKINRQHRLDVLPPAVSNTEIIAGLPGECIHSVIVVQSDLALTALFKIFGGTKVCRVCPSFHLDLRMDEFVMKMRNPQHREQPVHNNLVDALMPDNTLNRIEVGQLIIALYIVQCGSAF